MKLLDCFSVEDSELRLIDLVRKTGLHKSTVYRLVEAMRSHGLVGLDAESGRYHPGLKLFELGMIAMKRLELGKQSEAILENLAANTGETAHLCVLDGPDIVAIGKVESRSALRIPSAAGYRTPAYCTAAGKAILAGLPAAERAAYLASTPLRPFTRNTITSAARLKAELLTIARQGYSIDNEEREYGVRCVAAAVRDHSGRTVAGIGILAPAIRAVGKRAMEATRAVIEAADLLSLRLGCKPPVLAERDTRRRRASA